jgi:5-methylcytosine-specific restriction protein A
MAKKSEIEPKDKPRLMDLVEAAGVDISDWANFKRGKKYAALNPRYCYSWAFVQPKKVVVINCWHDGLKQKKGANHN